MATLPVVGCSLVSETTTSSGSELPPPGPAGLVPPSAEPAAHAPPPLQAPWHQPRPGQLTAAWRVIVATTWVGVFVAYMAVWKASDELGIATWWLGPRSGPQPLVVRLIPFFVATTFVILASYNVRRMPVFGLIGAVILAAIAVPDLSRSTGLAIIEFAIAAAALLVSAASFTGTYREPTSDHAG